MLFDPKIKYNGKLKRVQFFDPSKVTLKDFDTIKNSFKPNDSLLISDEDSIVEAFAKLEETIHPTDSSIKIDIDAMKKLYPNSIVADGDVIKPIDGMKIIFNRNLDFYRGNNFNTPNSGNIKISFSINFEDDSEIKEYYKILSFDARTLSMTTRTIIYSEFLPSNIGNFDLSEFQFFYIILEPYVSKTNYITIYKANVNKIGSSQGMGRQYY